MSIKDNMVSFSPIPAIRFKDFHRNFKLDTWSTCAKCGGQCEINKVGSLMPGEADFMAESICVSPIEFRNKYLDGILTPFGIVEVLKMKPGCPFLSSDYKCTITDIKVILCEIYPIVFEVGKSDVQFMLDDWCPIVRDYPNLRDTFEEKAIPAIRKLDAPLDWYRAVELYDALCVDYHKLSSRRDASLMDFAVVPIEVVRQCQADEEPPPQIHKIWRKNDKAPIDIIIKYHKLGYENSKISKEINVPMSTISSILKRKGLSEH